MAIQAYFGGTKVNKTIFGTTTINLTARKQPFFLLQENQDFLLQENGDKLEL